MRKEDLLEMMSQLAVGGDVMEPGAAVGFLTEYLERAKPTMKEQDFNYMVLVGATVIKLTLDSADRPG